VFTGKLSYLYILESLMGLDAKVNAVVNSGGGFSAYVVTAAVFPDYGAACVHIEPAFVYVDVKEDLALALVSYLKVSTRTILDAPHGTWVEEPTGSAVCWPSDLKGLLEGEYQLITYRTLCKRGTRGVMFPLQMKWTVDSCSSGTEAEPVVAAANEGAVVELCAFESRVGVAGDGALRFVGEFTEGVWADAGVRGIRIWLAGPASFLVKDKTAIETLTARFKGLLGRAGLDPPSRSRLGGPTCNAFKMCAECIGACVFEAGLQLIPVVNLTSFKGVSGLLLATSHRLQE
jgi:hypothetical protein